MLLALIYSDIHRAHKWSCANSGYKVGNTSNLLWYIEESERTLIDHSFTEQIQALIIRRIPFDGAITPAPGGARPVRWSASTRHLLPAFDHERDSQSNVPLQSCNPVARPAPRVR